MDRILAVNAAGSFILYIYFEAEVLKEKMNKS